MFRMYHTLKQMCLYLTNDSVRQKSWVYAWKMTNISVYIWSSCIYLEVFKYANLHIIFIFNICIIVSILLVNTGLKQRIWLTKSGLQRIRPAFKRPHPLQSKAARTTARIAVNFYAFFQIKSVRLTNRLKCNAAQNYAVQSEFFTKKLFIDR